LTAPGGDQRISPPSKICSNSPARDRIVADSQFLVVALPMTAPAGTSPGSATGERLTVPELADLEVASVLRLQ